MELFKKLNLKDQQLIYVLNAPAGFGGELSRLPAGVTVKNSLAGAGQVAFLLAFVTRQKEVDDLASALPALTAPDAIIWLAYPKGTSKNYTCEFNRDTGWAEMGKNGFEPVRQVAIDADWSALRFRNPDYIKKMTRSFAMTEKGKQKVAAARRASKK
jgi:hypothetical protein